MATEIVKNTEGYQMGTTKIIKSPQGYKLEGDPVDLNVDKVDGKHASDLKHGIAEDDQTAIKVNIGGFVCPFDIGYRTIATVGFKPRYVEFRVYRDTTADAQVGIGWMGYTGSQNCVAFCVHSPDQATFSKQTQCLMAIDQYCNYEVYANFYSMNSNGFTIYFGKTNPAFRIQFKAVR